MKRVILAVLTALCCLSCTRELTLQERILQAYDHPVRPGYEGKNPYWNKFAKKFMYAPAFDFQKVEGAATYRYTITQDGKENPASWTFEAKAPNLALTPVWKDITVGDVVLKVEAIDKVLPRHAVHTALQWCCKRLQGVCNPCSYLPAQHAADSELEERTASGHVL